MSNRNTVSVLLNESGEGEGLAGNAVNLEIVSRIPPVNSIRNELMQNIVESFLKNDIAMLIKAAFKSDG